MLLYATTKGGLYMSKCLENQASSSLLILLLCYININTVNTVSMALSSFFPHYCSTLQCFTRLLWPFSRSPAK